MESAKDLCSDEYVALFSSPGLRAICERRLAGIQCAYILRQYQKYVEAFPRLLALGISKLESDEARLPLVANLWEEHGEGDLRRAHRNLYKAMLSRIADEFPSLVDVLTRQYSMPITRFVSDCETSLGQSTAASAMGFLGPGTEGTTPELYGVLSGLLGPLKLEDEDTFFNLHRAMDVEHAKLFSPAIRIVLQAAPESGRREYVSGATAALRFERLFWDSVVDESETFRA